MASPNHKNRFTFILITIAMICHSQAVPSPPNETDKNIQKDPVASPIISTGKETCFSVPYKQDIIVPGCAVKTIDNRYCNGNCVSGYVPENGVNGRYKCSSCQPSKTTRKMIELNCRDGRKKLVEVEIFESCKCQQSSCQVSARKNIKDSETTMKSSTNKKKFDPVRPCRYICRECRKSRRDYDVLQTKKEKNEYLVKSCRTVECRKRILNHEDVTELAKVQKKLKKAVCKECKLCKKRKREKANA
uniref:CTCK domain-containing protein n=1 Tax=Clytia hemisphaerica TaxID=252671 RepID=A0A7M5V7D7_9CNID